MSTVKVSFVLCHPQPECLVTRCVAVSGDLHRPVQYVSVEACAAQASKGVEKKGAKLLSIEASAQVKAAQAEAKQQAKAAAKRKRLEEKQAEKADLKRQAADPL